MSIRVKTIEELADLLRNGGACVFPTDTVYGLGVAVDHDETPKQLYEIKGRAENKPVAWLVDDASALDAYGVDVPNYARELAAKYWPGALTIIVKASSAVPTAFVPESGTIGLRMPNCEITLALIKAVGKPLATTSANLSGEPAVSVEAKLDEAILSRAQGVLLCGDCVGACASTVVDCTGDKPKVLRQGQVVIGQQTT